MLTPPGITPYYQEGNIAIIHGRAEEVLPQFSAGTVDLILTDPPYNVGLDYGPSVNDERSDYAAWAQQWFSQCQVISPLIALTPGIANVALWCAIKPPTWIIAWLKPAAMGRCLLGFNNWEPVLLWGDVRTRATTDVIKAGIVPHPELDAFPCPKPLGWALQLIEKLSKPSGVILDPFAGSMQVAIAAKLLGRTCICIEANLDFCYYGVNRLRQAVLPFEVPPPEPHQLDMELHSEEP